MQVILLEKIVNLGNLGDVVKVKDGFARNFLIPTKRARRATEAAIKEFEDRRADLEKAAADRRSDCTFSRSARRVSNSLIAVSVARRALPCGIRKLRA